MGWDGMGKMSLCTAAVEFNVLVYCRCFWVMWRGWLGSVVVEWLRCVGGFLDRDVEERRRCAGRIVVVGGRESVDMMTKGGGFKESHILVWGFFDVM